MTSAQMSYSFKFDREAQLSIWTIRGLFVLFAQVNGYYLKEKKKSQKLCKIDFTLIYGIKIIENERKDTIKQSLQFLSGTKDDFRY